MIYRTDVPEMAISNVHASLMAIIKLWAEQNPRDLVDFDAQMKVARQTRSNEKSTSNNMLYKGEVPTRLYHMISRRYGRGWAKDPRVMRAFWSIFKVGAINRTSVSKR